MSAEDYGIEGFFGLRREAVEQLALWMRSRGVPERVIARVHLRCRVSALILRAEMRGEIEEWRLDGAEHSLLIDEIRRALVA